MNELRRLLVVLAASCSTPAIAQQASLAHIEDVLDWRVTARTARDAADAAGFSASFSAFGRQFDLDLEANARINALSVTGSDTARAYLGRLRDDADTWARIVISAGGPSGVIWDGATLYGIESSIDAAGVRIFRADDVVIPPGTMSCGMHEPVGNAAAMFAELATMSPEIARAAGATLNLDLGVVSDGEFGLLYPDPAAAMLTRINNIDGIYSEQLGVQITVQQTDVYADAASDPFSSTDVAEDLLNELAIFRGATPAQDAQGLTHLFTGRELDGSTVGIAYVNVVCEERWDFDPELRSVAVGLTQANFGPAGEMLESLIAAHEIGHNFGAPHDGETGECAAAPAGFLMSAMLDPTADEFSQCSIDVINTNLPSYDCLSPIPSIDVAIIGQSGTASPLTETDFQYTVTVTNQGELTAAATTAQLVFDASLTVISVTPQSGTCGPAQSTVDCDLGDIPGASTRIIDVTLQAPDAGDKTIDGIVASADDVNAGNNSFSDSVSVQPASDLALITAPLTLNLNEQTAVSATLENRSGIAASNVSISGSYSAGIEVASAEISGGTCSIDGVSRSFDCQITALAGLSSGELSVSLSGVEMGSQVLTLNVSAQESDPNAANNSSNVALEVVDNVTPTPEPEPSAPAAQEGGGGGGGIGPLALLILLGAWVRRRRYALNTKANFS